MTREIVNVMSAFKLSLTLWRKRLALKLQAFRQIIAQASNIAAPWSLSLGIKALTDQAAPHHSHNHADGAAAALDNISVMCKERISKQAAPPAATPNSSETQPDKSIVNWKRLFPASSAATVDPLLDAALRLNRSHEVWCLTLMLCRQAPVAESTPF